MLKNRTNNWKQKKSSSKDLPNDFSVCIPSDALHFSILDLRIYLMISFLFCQTLCCIISSYLINSSINNTFKLTSNVLWELVDLSHPIHNYHLLQDYAHFHWIRTGYYTYYIEVFLVFFFKKALFASRGTVTGSLHSSSIFSSGFSF